MFLHSPIGAQRLSIYTTMREAPSLFSMIAPRIAKILFELQKINALSLYNNNIFLDVNKFSIFLIRTLKTL